jgi:hypothetical protein
VFKQGVDMEDLAHTPVRRALMRALMPLVLAALLSACAAELTPTAEPVPVEVVAEAQEPITIEVSPDTGKPVAVQVAAPTVPATRGMAVCLDASGSMEQVAPGVIALLQERIAEMADAAAPGTEPDWTAGFPGRPGLEIRLRTLLRGSSLSSAGELMAVTVPGVPSAIPQPQPGDPGYSQVLSIWAEQRDAAAARIEAARAAAEEAGTAIRAKRFPEQDSEMAGCAAQAATTLRDLELDRPLVILASDLSMTHAPQVPEGAFAGVDLLVVHICSDSDLCDLQRTEWTELLAQHGVSPSWLTPEAFAPAAVLQR